MSSEVRRAVAWSDHGRDPAPGRTLDASAWLRRLTLQAAILAVAGQSLVFVLNVVAFDQSIEMLDIDLDVSVFAWVSAAATAACVPAAVALAAVRPALRTTLWVLVGACAFLSLDDALALHERVAELDEPLGLGSAGGRLVWPVIWAPLLIGTFLAIRRVARASDPPDARMLRTGLVLLALAVALEFFSYALDE